MSRALYITISDDVIALATLRIHFHRTRRIFVMTHKRKLRKRKVQQKPASTMGPNMILVLGVILIMVMASANTWSWSDVPVGDHQAVEIARN